MHKKLDALQATANPTKPCMDNSQVLASCAR